MQLDQRDLTIIQLVTRFGQLSSSQIFELVFAGFTSDTPGKRALRRLVDRKFLSRIERRMVGGSRGGSGQYVYQLGPEGHRLVSSGRWIPSRAINYHKLAIADCHVVMRRLERAGILTLVVYSTEPHCHIKIGRHDLRPDMSAEVDNFTAPYPLRMMLEIDMGTEGQRQITQKLLDYWQARRIASPTDWPENQLVVFIAIDDERARELRWLLSKGKPEQQELFRIHTLATFEQALSTGI